MAKDLKLDVSHIPDFSRFDRQRPPALPPSSPGVPQNVARPEGVSLFLFGFGCGLFVWGIAYLIMWSALNGKC